MKKWGEAAGGRAVTAHLAVVSCGIYTVVVGFFVVDRFQTSDYTHKI
jgi:hypothetical protein